jgi:multidrug efflux pump subunit AcrA (membrane-fusion protein)
MKKHSVIIGLFTALNACSGSEETYEVREREFNEAVYASGQVMPAEYRFMEVNAAERIMKILVEEGDAIESGNIIAVLGTPSENRQLEILTSQVALARDMAGEESAVLDELQARTRLAQEKFRQDSLDAIRYQQLAEEKAVSQREAEKVQLEAESSRTEHHALQRQYESRRNELNRNVLNAEQQLAQLSQSREGKILESPINGKVFRIYHKEGSLAQPGEPVAMVGDADRYKLELLVDERDISRVKLGQTVYFQTEAHADKQFEARISKVVPVLQRESRSFEVEAEVVSAEELYPQSSVEANILIRNSPNALVIPADFLISDDSVGLRRGNNIRTVKIGTGARDGSWVEVRSGLKAGDIIAKLE